MENLRFEIGELTAIEEIKEFQSKNESGAVRHYRLTIKLLTVSPKSSFSVRDICNFGRKVFLYAPFLEACGIPYKADEAEAAVKPDLGPNSADDKWIELRVRVSLYGKSISEADLKRAINEKLYIGNVTFDYWKDLKSNVRRIREWNAIMPEAGYADLDRCVQCALATGNHLAFAKFFTEKAKPRKEIAAVVLKKYIDNYNEKHPGQGKDEWRKKWKILPSVIWRSLNFEYTEKNLVWNAYGQAQMKKWIDADGPIPDKDVLVQLALCMGLDGRKTDRLLMAAGYDRLYLLDAADLFAKIALDQNGNDADTSDYDPRKVVFEQQKAFMNSQADSKSPSQSGVNFIKEYGNRKIKYLLNELEPGQRSDFENDFLSALEARECAGEFQLERGVVNSILLDLQRAGNLDDRKWDIRENKNKSGDVKYIDIKEAAKETHTRWRIKKQSEDSKMDIVVWRFEDVQIAKYNKELSNNIEEDIRNFTKGFEEFSGKENEFEEFSDKEKVQETEYLTNLMGELYRDQKVTVTENGSISISLPDENYVKPETNENHIKPEELIEQRHYGYLKKMDNFLKDLGAYEKNLPDNFCKWKWEWSGDVSDLVTCVNHRGRFPNGNEEKPEAKNEEKPEENKEENNKEKSGFRMEHALNQATMIWNRRSRLCDPDDYPNASERRSTLRNMLFGRGDQNKFNLITQIDKADFLKFLVITGHEELIGTYMKKLGFWEENLYLKTAGLHTDPKDFQMESCDYICDRKDLLLLYALKYRDEMLDSYLFSDRDVEKRQDLKQEFPFLELVMEISNTILRSYYLQGRCPYPLFHGPWMLCGAGIDGIVYSDDIMFFEVKNQKVRGAENER